MLHKKPVDLQLIQWQTTTLLAPEPLGASRQPGPEACIAERGGCTPTLPASTAQPWAFELGLEYIQHLNWDVCLGHHTSGGQTAAL